jgi:hypothetical protein
MHNLRASVALAFATLLVGCGGGGGACNCVAPIPEKQPVILSPASLTFINVGPSATASEANYTGTFSIDTTTSTCINAAKGAASVQSVANSSTSFSITPMTPGKCAISVVDDAGTAATINVSIATTTVGGS